MTLALICSGQGRINRDMLSPFVDRLETQPIMRTAERVLGQAPLELLHHGSAHDLQVNRTSQLLCVTRSLCAAAVLDASKLPPDTIITGYSVGELSAWGIAGVWEPATTVELAALRAEAMDRVGGATGSLGYVRGLPEAAVEELCSQFHCFIAIRNPNSLFVVGGDAGDVSFLCDAAPSRGAVRAAPMGVQIASHTPRLAEAVKPFEDSLLQHPTASPRLRLMSTTSQSLVSNPTRAIPDLAAQIARPIDWEATLVALQERGVRRVLELGPGSALAEMATGFSNGWEARSFDDFETVAGAVRWADCC